MPANLPVGLLQNTQNRGAHGDSVVSRGPVRTCSEGISVTGALAGALQQAQMEPCRRRAQPSHKPSGSTHGLADAVLQATQKEQGCRARTCSRLAAAVGVTAVTRPTAAGDDGGRCLLRGIMAPMLVVHEMS